MWDEFKAGDSSQLAYLGMEPSDGEAQLTEIGSARVPSSFFHTK